MADSYGQQSDSTAQQVIEHIRRVYAGVIASSQRGYVVPGDQQVLGDEIAVPLSYESFVERQAHEKSQKFFHTALLPVPWIGSPGTARVIILMLNPGLHPLDYYAEVSPNADKAFVSAVTGNLLGTTSEYPFYFLDPAFCWHLGSTYWHKRLDWIIRELAPQMTSVDDATRFVAREVCVVQAVPYHSASFPALRTPLDRLPSTQLALELVEALSADKERLIVAMRKDGLWRIRPACSRIVAKSAYRRGASMPKGSDHGNAILEQLLRLT